MQNVANLVGDTRRQHSVNLAGAAALRAYYRTGREGRLQVERLLEAARGEAGEEALSAPEEAEEAEEAVWARHVHDCRKQPRSGCACEVRCRYCHDFHRCCCSCCCCCCGLTLAHRSGLPQRSCPSP